MPSAWEFAGHAATRASLLKRGPTRHSCGQLKVPLPNIRHPVQSGGLVRQPACGGDLAISRFINHLQNWLTYAAGTRYRNIEGIVCHLLSGGRR